MATGAPRWVRRVARAPAPGATRTHPLDVGRDAPMERCVESESCSFDELEVDPPPRERLEQRGWRFRPGATPGVLVAEHADGCWRYGSPLHDLVARFAAEEEHQRRRATRPHPLDVGRHPRWSRCVEAQSAPQWSLPLIGKEHPSVMTDPDAPRRPKSPVTSIRVLNGARRGL